MAENPKTVEEVCEFLSKRGVEASVINTFRHEKMDATAVNSSSDEELKTLGLVKRGDIFAAKYFCTFSSEAQIIKDERNERKRQLLAVIKVGSCKKKPKTTQVTPSENKAEKKKSVQVGWMHFDSSRGKYSVVRLSKGGGTRNTEMPYSFGKAQAIKSLKSLFFPNDESSVGSLSDMDFKLGDFTGTEIDDDQWTIEKYIKEHKLSKTKLYVMTKPSELDEILDDSPFEDTIEEIKPLSPLTDVTQTEKIIFNDIQFDVGNFIDVPEETMVVNDDLLHGELPCHSMIGTTTDRKSLKECQDYEYHESLLNDQAKSRREELKLARAARVPSIPDMNSGSQLVNVSVRHVSLGTVSRYFDANICNASVIYDWIGSMSAMPEHFVLSTHSEVVRPSSSILSLHKSMLYMTETESTPAFPDEEVQFLGYGGSTVDSIIPSSSTESMFNNEYNSVVIDEDNIPTPSSMAPEAKTRFLRVRRVSVLKDLISAFKDETVMSCDLTLVAVNERGQEEMGIDNGGVFRDLLSAFWEAFYNSCTIGEDDRVPVIRHDYKNDDWAAVARVLVKGFKQYNFFPFRLCKCVLAMALFGEESLSNKMLLDSFQAYLSRDERELVNSALNSSIATEQYDEWCDFLDRFSCKRIPKNEKGDIESVLVEIAHKELVQVCKYITDSWKEPLRELYDDCEDFKSVTSLTNLYQKVLPTNRKVLELFHARPESNAERDTFCYLKRFIRGLTAEKLELFLRYCTGASVLCVERVIVDFTSEEGLARRPIAHTCQPLLQLPSTYASFPEFREEFNAALNSNYWDIDIA